MRELLRILLGGTDPNNILGRLMGRGQVRAVRGLPQNRSYYVVGAPLGPQALHQRLAQAWHLAMTKNRVALRREELAELFGIQAPPGVHFLDLGSTPRLLHVYVPETVEVALGIAKHVERAKTYPSVAAAMKEHRYGFLTLVPWASRLEDPLQHAATTKTLTGIEAAFIGQARKLLALEADLEFARAPDPQSLALALKEAV